MDILTLLYVDSGLETVPEALWGERDVVAHARRRGKKPGETLLDVSIHYSSMRRLEEWWKRGRPDILHVSLLVSQGMLLNRRGLLRTFIHTYSGVVIRVDSATRIPRNYNRFVGLMEQLLHHGRVPLKGKALMEKIGGGVASLLDDLKIDFLVVMDERGKYMSPRRLAALLSEYSRPAVAIGCFQRGAFSREVESLGGEHVSIAPIPLDAWVVAAKVLSEVEDIIGLYEVSR